MPDEGAPTLAGCQIKKDMYLRVLAQEYEPAKIVYDLANTRFAGAETALTPLEEQYQRLTARIATAERWLGYWQDELAESTDAWGAAEGMIEVMEALIDEHDSITQQIADNEIEDRSTADARLDEIEENLSQLEQNVDAATQGIDEPSVVLESVDFWLSEELLPAQQGLDEMHGDYLAAMEEWLAAEMALDAAQVEKIRTTNLMDAIAGEYDGNQCPELMGMLPFYEL